MLLYEIELFKVILWLVISGLLCGNTLSVAIHIV
jgi:hypothetical protein